MGFACYKRGGLSKRFAFFFGFRGGGVWSGLSKGFCLTTCIRRIGWMDYKEGNYLRGGEDHGAVCHFLGITIYAANLH